GEDCGQGVPLDGDVVHEPRPHVEAGDEVLRPVADVDAVVAVHAAGLRACAPVGARGQRHAGHGAEVRGVEVYAEVAVPDLDVSDPALRNVLHEEAVVPLLPEVTGVGRPGEVQGQVFDAELPDRRGEPVDFRGPLRA